MHADWIAWIWKRLFRNSCQEGKNNCKRWSHLDKRWNPKYGRRSLCKNSKSKKQARRWSVKGNKVRSRNWKCQPNLKQKRHQLSWRISDGKCKIVLPYRAPEYVQGMSDWKSSKERYFVDMRFGRSFAACFKTKLRAGSFLLFERIHCKAKQ